jgi:hypothetical protein
MNRRKSSRSQLGIVAAAGFVMALAAAYAYFGAAETRAQGTSLLEG